MISIFGNTINSMDEFEKLRSAIGYPGKLASSKYWLRLIKRDYVGIIFMIPGMEETFRVNGKACISQDQQLLEKTAANGKTPLLGIGVEIEECYMHCAKAFKRSGLWTPDKWPLKSELPSAAKIITAHVSKQIEVTEEQVRESLDDSYQNRLY